MMKKINRYSLCLILLLAGYSLQAQLFQAIPGPVTSTSSDSRGVNFLDLNNDGWEDIFVANGYITGRDSDSGDL